MHGVVAGERHRGRRANKTLERANARRRSEGAAQRAADRQDTGARERTASEQGSGAASCGRARHRDMGDVMPSQASDERVALPPSTRMEAKNEAKGRKRTGEPNSQAKAKRHIHVSARSSLMCPFHGQHLKRKQQSGKEQNNYDEHEHTQRTRDAGKLLDTCDRVRVSVKVIASAVGCTGMRVCNKHTSKQTTELSTLANRINNKIKHDSHKTDERQRTK